MTVIDLLPEALKREAIDSLAEFLAELAEKYGKDKVARNLKQLSSQADFYKAFDEAMQKGLERFQSEYALVDEDLVIAVTNNKSLWESPIIRKALVTLIRRPGLETRAERELLSEHFADVFPERINRDRVDKAVSVFLRSLVEELWSLPGAREIREVYSLQFRRVTAEAAREQVMLARRQLEALEVVSGDIHEALLKLTDAIEQRLIAAPKLPPVLSQPRPYHNLPQPDYVRFIGRYEERKWLSARLSPDDRAWQIGITGIGGVGKSALAHATAYENLKRYNELPDGRRFDVIVWISAKEEILTPQGSEDITDPAKTLRTLEDMYTTIALTLGREDITRALPEHQNSLVEKALASQRSLLVIDNLESVTDKRVRLFLRHLPAPTKVIITSREWVDVADMLRLTGLPPKEAETMILEEASVRGVELGAKQLERLMDRTSGLPLPIKISVARLASGETFEQVIRWLGNVKGNLPEYCIKGQIDLAHNRDPLSWRLLLCCSLFDQTAGVSREVLGEVADLSVADRDDGIALLLRLSLINQTLNDRFWLPPIVHTYVEGQLQEVAESAQIIERWLAWATSFAREYGETLDLKIERINAFATDYPNLRGAVRWCYEHNRWKMLLSLAAGSLFYPSITGLYNEHGEILSYVIDAARALHNEEKEAHFMRKLGWLTLLQGRQQDALVLLDTAEALAAAHNSMEVLVEIWYLRANVLSAQGDLQGAIELMRQAWTNNDSVSRPQFDIIASSRLAILLAKAGRFSEVFDLTTRAKQKALGLNWKRGLALLLYREARILHLQGEYDRAEQLYIESLTLNALWNGAYAIVQNKTRLVRIYEATERFELARQMAEEVKQLRERLGLPAKMADIQGILEELPNPDRSYPQ